MKLGIIESLFMSMPFMLILIAVVVIIILINVLKKK